jgi:hypothetical protein
MVSQFVVVQKVVPGFTETFGGPKPEYDVWLKDVSPNFGAVYCISVNIELHASLPYEVNQARIMQQTQSAFKLQQKLAINAVG